MTDSEKLELVIVYTELMKLQTDLTKIIAKVKGAMAGIPDPQAVKQPNGVSTIAPAKNPGLQPVEAPKLGTSIHDSVGNIPVPSQAEIRSHTLDFNEHITKGH